ncbi:MAG: PhoU domain-containing protein [Microbacteriaceae bacterium]|nr:PhoU domain-containing protein [Microbacteriaceae bacterium]
MREVFQQELSEVQDRLVTIASEATETMKLATQAFLTSDVALADQALEKADANEAHALDLDELVIKVLATQGPVAKDLRILVSALRMSASLERMGGLAGHIAAIARFRYPGSAIPEVVRPVFEKMSELDVASVCAVWSF